MQKYGFCWRSETLVLKKASKLNKLPALSRWHLLGYFLSFRPFSFFFFLRASQVSESRWCGEHGPPLQGFSERGGGERRTTASACERSRGGVNERGRCPFHSSTHTTSGCQQRGHTLIHRSLLSNAERTRDFIIY